MAEHPGLPVAGYRAQSDDKVGLVNDFKRAEEQLLRILDDISSGSGREKFDQRWLAIARTHFEQGYMALNRSVFRPERIQLPADTE